MEGRIGEREGRWKEGCERERVDGRKDGSEIG